MPLADSPRFPRRLIASTAALAIASGTVGVGLLLTPVGADPAAAAPMAASSEKADDLLRPAAEVQAPATDADPGDGATPATPLAPAERLTVETPDPEETVTVVVRSDEPGWFDFEGTQGRVERAARAGSARGGRIGADRRARPPRSGALSVSAPVVCDCAAFEPHTTGALDENRRTRARGALSRGRGPRRAAAAASHRGRRPIRARRR